VQLIDVETGNHPLWPSGSNKPITDLFDMQDEIVSSLGQCIKCRSSLS